MVFVFSASLSDVAPDSLILFAFLLKVKEKKNIGMIPKSHRIINAQHKHSRISFFIGVLTISIFSTARDPMEIRSLSDAIPKQILKSREVHSVSLFVQ